MIIPLKTYIQKGAKSEDTEVPCLRLNSRFLFLSCEGIINDACSAHGHVFIVPQEAPACPTPSIQSHQEASVSAKKGVRHQRHPSAVSVPESDISSCGTFIDKGSLEGTPMVEDSPQAGAGSKGISPPAGIAGTAAVAKYSPLKPPESAFSSDMSEQHSGQVL
jgi:hypothetical protein